VKTTTKLALLSTLYLSQGLPYGFFVNAVPTLLRKSGVSLAVISLSTALMLPWGLKLFIAPLVDKHRGSPLGARRGWIVPLQLATTLITLAIALFTGADGALLYALAAATIITAALAATQDCATDGLAVDLLDDKERGLGNGIQVGAYRVGMIIGGGGLLILFDALGFRMTFVAMAALLALATLPILLWREPPSTAPEQAARFGDIFTALFSRKHAAVWLLLIIAYKIGDAYGSPMVKPLLVDRGLSISEIGELSGVYGSGAAVAGALLGGWLASRAGRIAALLSAGIIHALLMAAYALPLLGVLGDDALLALVVAEHLTGSAATVALFTVMMDASERATGASDYTAQASIIVWATFAGAVPSGFITDLVGYPTHFFIAGAVCLLGTIALVVGLARGVMPRAPA
jgi:PAT family beta-lactamase induction signal transducer AmpG